MTVTITAIDLHASVDGAALLQGVSLNGSAGEFIGLIGPNGAGKTTLLRCLAGLLSPTSGSVRLNTDDIAYLAPSERARRLAYLPQARNVHWDMTVEAVVALGRFAFGAPTKLSPGDQAAVDNAMAITNVAHLRARKATTLSGGEAARMHLARTLAAQTPIVIADEPAAALDPEQQLAILRLLQNKAEQGAAVIAALHDLSLARRFCTRLLVLHEGAVHADGPADDVLTDQVFNKVFSLDKDARKILGIDLIS